MDKKADKPCKWCGLDESHNVHARRYTPASAATNNCSSHIYEAKPGPFDTIQLPGITIEIWCFHDEPGFYACKEGEERALACTTLDAVGGEIVWIEDGYTVKSNERPYYALLVERAFSIWLVAHYCQRESA